MNNPSDINTKLDQIARLISQEKADDALSMLEELKPGHSNDKRIIFNEPGVLIDAGAISKDCEKIAMGIHKGEALLEGDLSSEQKAHMHYNIANGYQSLFSLKQHRKVAARLNNDNLQKAKHHLRQALRLNPGPDLKVRILVNYGNCLDSLGRVLEALYCYDNALKINRNHSMAIGNRAMAKVFFANISGAFRAKTYVEAYQDIKSIIDKEDLLSVGGYFAYEAFKRELEKIESMFKDRSVLEHEHKLSGKVLKYASPFEKEYIELCRKHKLFLNLRTDEHDDPDSILDSAFIRIITPVDDDTTFYALAKKLNDIKEDFLISKLLLAQSQFRQDDLTSISKKVAFVNTLDYANYNIYSALLKSAFRTCFNILDKIAFFINDYLDLKMKDSRIYFHTIWEDSKTKAVKEKIRNTENISLFALYDMHLDLGRDKRLKKLRNSITHRKLTIYDSMITTKWDDKEDDENIGSATMLSETIELMKFVRSAIIYLMNFVEMEENKKRAKLKGIVPPIFADTEQFM